MSHGSSNTCFWRAIFGGVLLGVAGIGFAADAQEDLRAELEALRHRLAELEARIADGADGRDAERRPQVSLGGQYRINAYSVDDGGPAGHQTASRVRLRNSLNIRFDERFKTHLQVELGHTADNTTTTITSSRENVVAVRHAVLDYRFDNGLRVRGGIVPLSDRFGDTLFSADWDYNPVALSLELPVGEGTLRSFAANLDEGSETIADDDFVHYQLDYAVPLSDGNQLNLGATVASIADLGGESRLHANYGIGGRFDLGNELVLRGFLMGSFTERRLLGANDDASGLAAKAELVLGNGLGMMATYASGDSDGTGFLPPMALARTYGYWGYTGILTVQGATDTGFDGDAVNVSNNGFGLTTIQVKYARPWSERMGVRLAAGWFGGTDGPSGRKSRVGLDFLGMGTYHFNEILALDVGVAYARLEDGVSGYSRGGVGGASFDLAPDEDREKLAFFGRLQAEF